MTYLSGKTAIVTGGAQGIGFACARRLVQEGVAVTIWDLDDVVLRHAAASLTGEHRHAVVMARVCDVTDRGSVEAAVAHAEAEMGRIDILINNAGYMAPGNLLDQPMQQWDATVDVNLKGVISCTYAVLPGMYARGTGHVVTISSAAATLGVAGLAVYTATKWAVWGLSESLRHEAINLGRPAVRFSSIHPHFLREGMFGGARLRGMGAVVVPNVRDHHVIAKAVVTGALKRGRRCLMRPRTVWLAVMLRGLLPNRVFEATLRMLGVPQGMSSWRGPN